MDADNKKRKSEGPNDGHAKKSKQWRTPKKGQHSYTAPSIEAGDAGIWATCEMGKEGKCTGELRDLFEEYAAKIYGNSKSANEEDGASDDYDAEVDIEAEIKAELEGMKASGKKKQPLFQAVKVDIQCVLFFKTHPPIEPVSFVHAICKDALEGGLKRGRWVKKLMPMTMMGKATPEGLGNVAERVLGPVFHTKPSEGEGQREGLRFAIRPTRRNHNVMKRDEIIRQVAAGVGRGHRVDLKNYDYLILVDVYRNILGMSVVDSDFEELKQFNLAEIYDPTPKPDAEKRTPSTKDSEEVADLKPDADEGKDPTPNADAEKSIDATPEEETEHHIPTPGLKEAQADPFPSAEDGNGACSKASAGAK